MDVHNAMKVVKDEENGEIKVCNYKYRSITDNDCIDSISPKEEMTSKNPDNSDEENGILDWFQESEDDDTSDCDSDYCEPSNKKYTINNKPNRKRFSDSFHLLSSKVIRSGEKEKSYVCNEPGCGKKFKESDRKSVV